MRKEFEMSKQQLTTLKEACKPVPYMIIGNSFPPSPQENANRAWETLGHEMGFKPMSAQPMQGKGIEYFTAEQDEKIINATIENKPKDRFINATLKDIVKQLESCSYDSEGGNLENNIAFIELKRRSEEGGK